MAEALGLIGAALVAALVAVAGIVFDRRSEQRLEREHQDKEDRLRLDAAMHAGSLFNVADGEQPSAAASGAALLALTRLNHYELAVTLLVDLWSSEPLGPTAQERLSGDNSQREPKRFSCVSTEIAILVIDSALRSRDPRAQLVAAELLCRNAHRLEPWQSLHWPSSVDAKWDPDFPIRAKLLVLDGLLRMTVRPETNQEESALRSLLARLFRIWEVDPNPRVRGCIGLLVECLLSPAQQLDYGSLIQGEACVELS